MKAPSLSAEPAVPTDLRKAVTASSDVEALWKSLTPLARRDFVMWIDSAKLPATRQRRIDSMGSRLKSGKRRPCCFSMVPMNLYKTLNSKPKAQAAWKSLTPLERRDFVTWIESAKQPEASKRRIEDVIEMLTAGKRRP